MASNHADAAHHRGGSLLDDLFSSEPVPSADAGSDLLGDELPAPMPAAVEEAAAPAPDAEPLHANPGLQGPGDSSRGGDPSPPDAEPSSSAVASHNDLTAASGDGGDGAAGDDSNAGDPPPPDIEPPSAAASRGDLTAASLLSGGDADGACQTGEATSQSLPSDRSDGGEGEEGGGSDNEEEEDSDREVVEEEDAFGDFADFTSASRFLPGGVGGLGAAPSMQQQHSQLTLGAGFATGRAASGAPGAPALLSHRHHGHHGHHSGSRSAHGLSGGGGSGGHSLHGASTGAGAVSEHGSLGGEASDFSHPSPPPSVAPSRQGGGRKSVTSLASVGSRAGDRDDDLGDGGSVVGSSVWRAPSHMATSSYAAAAGADDDFGDFTSDITSTSDFAPSTQPPSAVAVSGPGSVHPDDDFGSFASHRSTADDDEDEFGNFAAAVAAAPAAAYGAAVPPGGAVAAAAGGSAGAGPSNGMGVGGGGAISPRDPFHSTQSVGPSAGGGGGGGEAAAAAAGAEAVPLLQLPSEELRQAVARALQPLLPPAAAAGGSAAPPPPLALPTEEQLAAAWAQLRRHMAGGTGVDAGVLANTGLPLPPLTGLGGPGGAEAAEGRGPYSPGAAKFPRPLRWKGSASERRLLAGLGLSEAAAAQARAAEAAAAEAPQRTHSGRVRAAAGGGGSSRQMGGYLASFGGEPVQRRSVGVEGGGSGTSLVELGSGSASAGGSAGGGSTPRAVGPGVLQQQPLMG